MATGTQLKNIALARLKSAEVLMEAEDWHGASYMLPYALECALKSVICKTLRIMSYPDNDTSKTDIRPFFTTHVFVQLIIVSGLNDIFSAAGQEIPFKYWSDFTLAYPGKWVGMRYDIDVMNQFDESRIKDLHNKLTEPTNGILTIIEREGRW